MMGILWRLLIKMVVPVPLWAFSMALANCVIAQQIADTSFHISIQTPAFPKGEGPLVVVDAAHYNFHTIAGRYTAFAQVLAADGYRLTSSTSEFERGLLDTIDVLVISNARADEGEWVLPARSAFTTEEIETVRMWVQDGGALFLIADHMPFAGAAADLAAAFGFNLVNGFAMRKDDAPEFFTRKDGSLHVSPITNGNSASPPIDSVLIFTGSALIAPKEAVPIMELGSGYEILLPSRAWQFNDSTARMDGMHMLSAAMLQYGKGRLVISCEAAMFAAQLAGAQRMPVGMNDPRAADNVQLLLNILHWLDGEGE